MPRDKLGMVELIKLNLNVWEDCANWVPEKATVNSLTVETVVEQKKHTHIGQDIYTDEVSCMITFKSGSWIRVRGNHTKVTELLFSPINKIEDTEDIECCTWGGCGDYRCKHCYE